jgi:inosine/xanthosine triphosphate pyrophosphatase family protein
VAAPERDKLILVSSNPNKAIEAERILGMPLVRAAIVAGDPGGRCGGRHALQAGGRSHEGYGLVVEGVALGFDELGNFPGSYVRWLLEAAGARSRDRVRAQQSRRERNAASRTGMGAWATSSAVNAPARFSCSRAAKRSSDGIHGFSPAGLTRHSPR